MKTKPRSQDLALLLIYLYYLRYVSGIYALTRENTNLNESQSRSELMFRGLDPDKLALVSGVTRLADKYLLNALRTRFVEDIASDWPRVVGLRRLGIFIERDTHSLIRIVTDIRLLSAEAPVL